jgi:hypothetical protein
VPAVDLGRDVDLGPLPARLVPGAGHRRHELGKVAWVRHVVEDGVGIDRDGDVALEVRHPRVLHDGPSGASRERVEGRRGSCQA